MTGILATAGSFLDSLIDPEEEQRKRAAFQRPDDTQPRTDAANTLEPDTQARIAGAIPASPALRRMFSLNAGSGATQPNAPYPETGGWLKTPTNTANANAPDTAADPNTLPGAGIERPDSSGQGLASTNPQPTPSKLQGDIQSYNDLAAVPIIHPGLHTEIDKYGNPIQKQSKKGWLGRLGAGAGDAALNWLKSGGAGGLPGLATHALGEGIDEAVHPDAPQERKKQRQLQKMWNNISAEAQLEKEQGDIDYKKAQSDWMMGRNPTATNIAQIKDTGLTKRTETRDLMQQYNHMPTFDATDPENADFIQAGKEHGLVFPSKSGKVNFHYMTNEKTGESYVDISDQSGERHLHKITNDDGTPYLTTTKSMMTATDKKEQRELQERLAKEKNITTIKAAEIGAKSRIDVANIGQEGKDKDREAKRIEFEQKFNADIAQKRAAGQYKKTATVAAIQAAVQARTMTQDYANKLIEGLPEQ